MRLPHGADQFYSLVNDRRSVRAFSTRPVDYDVIAKCVLAAGTSPSGAHTEPWTFCVVGSASVKSAIRDIIEYEEYENYSRRMSRQWTADLTPLQTNYEKPYLTEAPYLILVFKQVYGTHFFRRRICKELTEVRKSLNIIIYIDCLQDSEPMEPKNNITITKSRYRSPQEFYCAHFKRPA